MAEVYDVAIVGGGPAGLTAGLYAARDRLRALLIEKALLGGQIANQPKVENYPAFPEGISGHDLSQLMHQQATRFGLETTFAEVVGLAQDRKEKVLSTSEGDYRARAVIVASGAEPSKLGVPGEVELQGRGVSYCALCDGPFFQDRAIAVVGGGDSAVDEALFLTRYASKVVLIHRRDQLRAGKGLQERAFASPRMEFIWDTVVEEVLGREQVEGLRLRNVKTGQMRTLEVGGIFIYTGLKPNTDYLKGFLELDPSGHIPVNSMMETSLRGVLAAGDVRVNSARQVVSAAGDGATAAIFAEHYLGETR